VRREEELGGRGRREGYQSRVERREKRADE
jgi:hypothetical protein